MNPSTLSAHHNEHDLTLATIHAYMKMTNTVMESIILNMIVWMGTKHVPDFDFVCGDRKDIYFIPGPFNRRKFSFFIGYNDIVQTSPN